jgi:hypothetical protein
MEKEKYQKAEINSEILEPEALLSCASGEDCGCQPGQFCTGVQF